MHADRQMMHMRHLLDLQSPATDPCCSGVSDKGKLRQHDASVTSRQHEDMFCLEHLDRAER